MKASDLIISKMNDEIAGQKITFHFIGEKINSTTAIIRLVIRVHDKEEPVTSITIDNLKPEFIPGAKQKNEELLEKLKIEMLMNVLLISLNETIKTMRNLPF